MQHRYEMASGRQMEKSEKITVIRVRGGEVFETPDQVAVEEPLEIILEYSTPNGSLQKTIAITMRTPGNEVELAVGFLFSEGIIPGIYAVKNVKSYPFDINKVLVKMAENVMPVLNKAGRNFYINASCGICGKVNMENVFIPDNYSAVNDPIRISADLLHGLPEKLKRQQVAFGDTGGIHACALFSLDGQLIVSMEDIGRHNALDKIIGDAYLKKQLPLLHTIILLSGRAGFELIQKAYLAGSKIVAAVGAPSSLAVEMAREYGITLVGFLRNGNFNIYSGEQRVQI